MCKNKIIKEHILCRLKELIPNSPEYKISISNNKLLIANSQNLTIQILFPI